MFDTSLYVASIRSFCRRRVTTVHRLYTSSTALGATDAARTTTRADRVRTAFVAASTASFVLRDT
jgi:hypothetical protein